MEMCGSCCKYYTTACGNAGRRMVVPTPSKLTKVRCIGIISWLMPSSSLTKTRDGVTRRFSSSTRPRPRWRSKKKADRNVRYTLAESLTVRRAFLDSWPFPLDAVREGLVRDEQQMAGNPFLGGAGTAGQVKLLQCLIYT